MIEDKKENDFWLVHKSMSQPVTCSWSVDKSMTTQDWLHIIKKIFQLEHEYCWKIIFKIHDYIITNNKQMYYVMEKKIIPSYREKIQH